MAPLGVLVHIKKQLKQNNKWNRQNHLWNPLEKKKKTPKHQRENKKKQKHQKKLRNLDILLVFRNWPIFALSDAWSGALEEEWFVGVWVLFFCMFFFFFVLSVCVCSFFKVILVCVFFCFLSNVFVCFL